MHEQPVNLLGRYLKDRRARLNPSAFGFPAGRRRTPGLRREEVALLANVSATWYTWLEQGRGGAPSAEVLERLARALTLNGVEREHLFLLAQNRLPEVRYQANQGMTPRLQRILDALTGSPALIKNASWDIIGWNFAASVILADYGQMTVKQRNLLRMIFGRSAEMQKKIPHWEAIARYLVATFRAETARHGIDTRPLVEELCASSKAFSQMWQENDVHAFGEGTKQIFHPQAGPITMEYATFAVDQQPELGLMIYQPASDEDSLKIQKIINQARQNSPPVS